MTTNPNNGARKPFKDPPILDISDLFTQDNNGFPHDLGEEYVRYIVFGILFSIRIYYEQIPICEIGCCTESSKKIQIEIQSEGSTKTLSDTGDVWDLIKKYVLNIEEMDESLRRTYVETYLKYHGVNITEIIIDKDDPNYIDYKFKLNNTEYTIQYSVSSNLLSIHDTSYYFFESCDTLMDVVKEVNKLKLKELN